MERPHLCSAVRCHVVHLGSTKPALLASPESTDPPPLVPAFEFQRTCMPPEEGLLVDSCFDNGDEEVVRYETVDEPERLDAGDVGER